MKEQVRTIKLSGSLAAKFGRVHRFAVSSAAEAIRALCVMVPGFERYLMEAKDNGLQFVVLDDRKMLAQEDLTGTLDSGSGELRIIPVVSGSKRGGILQTIVGAVLVVAGYIVTGLTYGWAAPVGQAMIGAGISMMVGGVVQMLAPTAKRDRNDDKDDRTSYTFNGTVNVPAQGAAAPVLYGEMVVGSVVVSAGISSEDNYVSSTQPKTIGADYYSDGGGLSGDVQLNFNSER